MRTIWKFPLGLADRQNLMLPRGARLLTVQMQNGIPTLWADVDNTQEMVPRQIAIYGTGHPLPDWAGVYLATVQDRQLVWHIYQLDA